MTSSEWAASELGHRQREFTLAVTWDGRKVEQGGKREFRDALHEGSIKAVNREGEG